MQRVSQRGSLSIQTAPLFYGYVGADSDAKNSLKPLAMTSPMWSLRGSASDRVIDTWTPIQMRKIRGKARNDKPHVVIARERQRPRQSQFFTLCVDCFAKTARDDKPKGDCFAKNARNDKPKGDCFAKGRLAMTSLKEIASQKPLALTSPKEIASLKPLAMKDQKQIDSRAKDYRFRGAKTAMLRCNEGWKQQDPKLPAAGQLPQPIIGRDALVFLSIRCIRMNNTCGSLPRSPALPARIQDRGLQF
jgi:hypothetical protein